MNLQEAQRCVIEAGHRLVAAGLIARTWGNISCRISDTQFVITPSGRTYDSLTPEDIVTVNIADCSYEGSIKPSSEKGIHADCYRLRSNVGFVIHTHQNNASVMSVLSASVKVTGDEKAILGPVIPIAAYGLPGTGKLRKGVSSCLTQYNDSKAVIMAHHGALCTGGSIEEAFICAMSVERVCGKLIKESTEAKGPSKEAVADERIIKAIQAARPEMKYVLFTESLYTVHASSSVRPIRPLLDDFAQLVGTSLKTADSIKDIAHCARGRNAILLRGKGAYCYAETRSDAEAVMTILIKNCRTREESIKLGQIHVLGRFDCLLMRTIYLRKYSKQAK